MTTIYLLQQQINERFADWIYQVNIDFDEVTIEVKRDHLLDLCAVLHDDPAFDCKLLVDVCGVDYLQYGLADWETEVCTTKGFSRGVLTSFVAEETIQHPSQRFAVVYHLLSLTQNHRLRLRVALDADAELIVDSVINIWPAANWFERETFDLFGILFKGHPDLRRLLTDYGFVGHPFRKDFPLIGKVEARYDATLKRVVYGPVSIEPRVLEPKVIRHDHRYREELKDTDNAK